MYEKLEFNPLINNYKILKSKIVKVKYDKSNNFFN